MRKQLLAIYAYFRPLFVCIESMPNYACPHLTDLYVHEQKYIYSIPIPSFLTDSRVGRFWVLRKVKLLVVPLGAK